MTREAFPSIEIPYNGMYQPLDSRGATAGASIAWLIHVYADDAFSRQDVPGHMTATAFVVSPDRTSTLLMHHKKLDRWLAPGGHCDGEKDAFAVALKEAQEETGLRGLRLAQETIFDADVHSIPARAEVARHLHFDLRILFEADPQEPLLGNHESLDLRWVKLEDLETYTQDPAMLILKRISD